MTKPRNSEKRPQAKRKPRPVDKELTGILRFWVYPAVPPRSDRWITQRALYDVLVKWKDKNAKP